MSGIVVESVRIAKATGLQLLLCLEHSVWGATRNRLQKWKLGDHLVIIGGVEFCGLAEVTGPAFTSEDLIFHGDFYPYRIPIAFYHIVASPRASEVVADIRTILKGRYGTRGGWPVLMQTSLPDDIGTNVCEAVRARPNALPEIREHLAAYLSEAFAGSNVQQS